MKKATPITPTGIPEGHRGPLYPGGCGTGNHGVKCVSKRVYSPSDMREEFGDELTDYARCRHDHKD